jgi:hypothetical protein
MKKALFFLLLFTLTTNLNAKEAKNAPFGFVWGQTKDEISNKGISLEKQEQSPQENTYKTNTPPKKVSGISQVRLSFGKNDKLWRIAGVSNIITDTNDGKNIKKIFNKLNKLLEKKYGKGKVIEKCKYEDKSMCENDGFMKALASGKAYKYSFFQNKTIMMQFTIGSISETQAFYSLIYKHKKFMEAEGER